MKKLRNRMVLLVLCLIWSVQTVCGAQLLVPGGQVIGLELLNDTVTVAAFDDGLGQAARNCGLQQKNIRTFCGCCLNAIIFFGRLIRN